MFIFDLFFTTHRRLHGWHSEFDLWHIFITIVCRSFCHFLTLAMDYWIFYWRRERSLQMELFFIEFSINLLSDWNWYDFNRMMWEKIGFFIGYRVRTMTNQVKAAKFINQNNVKLISITVHFQWRKSYVTSRQNKQFMKNFLFHLQLAPYGKRVVLC